MLDRVSSGAPRDSGVARFSAVAPLTCLATMLAFVAIMSAACGSSPTAEPRTGSSGGGASTDATSATSHAPSEQQADPSSPASSHALATVAGSADDGSAASEPLRVVSATVDAALVVENHTLYVGPEREPCPGLTEQQCLVVRLVRDEPFEPWFGSIDGFDFESGYSYELLVQRSMVEGASGGDAVWRLVEIVEKAPVAGTSDVLSLEDAVWQLLSYRDAHGDRVRPPEGTLVTIEMSDGKVSGTSGCNTYLGSYERDDTYLSVAVDAVTERACVEVLMALEGAFLQALADTETYLIVGSQLQLANAAGLPLLTFRATAVP